MFSHSGFKSNRIMACLESNRRFVQDGSFGEVCSQFGGLWVCWQTCLAVSIDSV